MSSRTKKTITILAFLIMLIAPTSASAHEAATRRSHRTVPARVEEYRPCDAGSKSCNSTGWQRVARPGPEAR